MPDHPTVALPALTPLVIVGGRAAYRDRDGARVGATGDVVEAAIGLERAEHPRWLVWEAADGLGPLVAAGAGPARCWDVAQVHRLLAGGWAAEPTRAWAHALGLSPAGMPPPPRGDLFDVVETGPQRLVDDRGYLHPLATTGAIVDSDDRLVELAALLPVLAHAQFAQVQALGPRAVSTAYAESAAAVLCLELERDGLPIDRQTATDLIEQAAGPRPRDEAEAQRIRAERDRIVLAHAPGRSADLRNPLEVKELLNSCGVAVSTTRKGELQPHVGTHPIVGALLSWRAAERIATTYGYRWLDEHVGADGRLRGAWAACDGAAGRMTAQAGLHNLPAALRAAVAAEPGHVFVRADLGQIEPRVLAAVSMDPAFVEATRAEDLYAPIAARLGVTRSVAKVAVLAAMYGQRSGVAGAALSGLQRAYPVAMALLDEAYAAGLARRPLRTFGGRLIRLDAAMTPPDPASAPAWDSARGRFARNAIIQGAAAELFKAWVATVRHLVRPLGGQVVLCLHDEVLLHVPVEAAGAARELVDQALTDATRRWVGSDAVRFVAQTSIVRNWAEAKD